MNKVIAPVIIGLLIIGGVFWFTQRDETADAPAPSSSTDSSTSTSTETPANASEAAVMQTIVYTNSGFTPGTITVKAGEQIKVTNNSSSDLDFASDLHPTHTKQPELNIGVIAPGESKNFNISKTGSWDYHNHDNASHTGTIVVQ